MSLALTEKRGATLLVTLNRPERRNAFDLEMREAIGEAVFAARDDAGDAAGSFEVRVRNQKGGNVTGGRATLGARTR